MCPIKAQESDMMIRVYMYREVGIISAIVWHRFFPHKSVSSALVTQNGTLRVRETENVYVLSS